MNIWFLFDGNAAECYEIQRFLEVAALRGYEAHVFNPNQFDILCSRKDPENVFVNDVSWPKPDVVIPRTGAGTTYLCLSVLRHLLRQDVMVVNRATAVEAVADKLRTTQILAEKGLPVPATMFGKFPVDTDLISRKIGFPVVVKTLKGTQGSGVYLSETPENLRDLTDLLAQQGQTDSPVLFQKFVKSSHGRDVRVFIVGGKVLACMERKATDGGFKANITRGGVGQAITGNVAMEQLALKVCEALHLDVAGIDLLYDDNGFTVCEANSAPDFKGLENYCGVSVPEIIYDFIEERLKKKARKPFLPAGGFFSNLCRQVQMQ